MAGQIQTEDPITPRYGQVTVFSLIKRSFFNEMPQSPILHMVDWKILEVKALERPRFDTHVLNKEEKGGMSIRKGNKNNNVMARCVGIFKSQIRHIDKNKSG